MGIGESMDFGEILSTTWKTTWKHKVLWWYWVIVYLLSLLLVGVFYVFPVLALERTGMVDEPWFAVALIILYFVLMLIGVFLGAVVITANTLGVVRVDRGAEKLTFFGLLKDSFPYFWRIVGVLLIFMATAVLVWLALYAIIMGVSLITLGIGMICFMPMFMLFIPALFVFYTWMELSEAAVIADNLSVKEALKRGWGIFRANFWQVILMTLLLYFGISAISMIPTFLLIVPIFVLFFGLIGQADPSIYITISIILFAVFIPIYVLISGVFQAFFKSAWAYTYLRLRRQPDMAVPPATGEAVLPGTAA
jgi:hypothetical protein